MIEVRNITKRFAGFTAVDNISFTVNRSEIAGFLGPNGAGKTTTMRILSCFFPPSTGSAVVAGFDVVKDSMEVRKRIGYMPENVPLYPEMRVKEYLLYRAALKQVPRSQRKARLDYVLDRCGIASVERKIIGHLSKGFRQRVGLADAMIHNPEILILDEPTIGLDPNQIIQIRSLIKDIGKEHTVLLSTHILPEVEAVCNRVIIINGGKIAASGTPDKLIGFVSEGLRIKTEIRGEHDAVLGMLKSLPYVTGVTTLKKDSLNSFLVICEEDKDVRETISQKCAEQRWPIKELRRDALTLEDIFVKITAGKTDEIGACK